MRKAILMVALATAFAGNTSAKRAKHVAKPGDEVVSYKKKTTNNQRKRRKKLRQTPQLLNSKKYS